MEKNIDLSKSTNAKINLNNIFTPKEIEDIKKAIPKINTSIIQNINKKNKNPNNSLFSKNKISRNSSYRQYIDRNKFIELILEKIKLIFKEENNVILFKSISFIMEEIKKMINESKKVRKNELSKLTNTTSLMNFDYNIKVNEKNLFSHKNSANINPFFVKMNSSWRDCSSRSNSKNKSNDYIPFQMKTNYNKYRIMSSTSNNSINKKFLDIGLENDYKMKNLKGSSIINNFITFSNTNQTINTSPNSHIKLNKANILGDINISNNNIYNISGISKFNTFYRKNNKSNAFKTMLSHKIQSQISNISININDTKTRKSSFNNNSKITNAEKSLSNIKNNTIEYEQQNNCNINNNVNNDSLKFKRLKTENIIENKSKILTKKSIKKPTKLEKKPKKVMFRKDMMKKNIINYTNIENKDFDIFEFDNNVGKENTLLFIGNYIYNKYSFSSIINEDKFNNWCRQIAAGYTRKNPYHSDLHGADVTQTCLVYTQYGDVIEIVKLNKVSLCSLFLSCICHDFKHPGVNNDFLKETKNELAIRYNDLSILENMHVSETFKLINQNNDCNIFFGVDSNTYKDIRYKMIGCVLSTDMSGHSKHINFMKKIIEANKKNLNKNDTNNNNNQEFLDLLVHAADISNPTKPFPVYLKWAKLVLEEFFQQGDREKALGLPCSNDRNTVKLNLSQVSFIDYVITPFISPYITIFPKLKFLQDNIIINREKFLNYCEDTKSKHNIPKITNKISKKISNLKESKIKSDNK